MWKELDQIMLPTEDLKNVLVLHRKESPSDIEFLSYNENQVREKSQRESPFDTFHLYVYSDDDIKEGNWFICDKKVYRATQVDDIQCFFGEGKSCTKIYCKKIIASTGESLEFIRHDLYPNGNTMGVRSLIEMPKLPLDWINITIEHYNCGNPINKVMVEYNDEGICRFHQRDGGYNDRLIGGDLRVNTDNTINIKLEKKSWNKDELIGLCQDAWSNSTIGDDEACYCFVDWLRENNLF